MTTGELIHEGCATVIQACRWPLRAREALVHHCCNRITEVQNLDIHVYITLLQNRALLKHLHATHTGGQTLTDTRGIGGEISAWLFIFPLSDYGFFLKTTCVVSSAAAHAWIASAPLKCDEFSSRPLQSEGNHGVETC